MRVVTGWWLQMEESSASVMLAFMAPSRGWDLHPQVRLEAGISMPLSSAWCHPPTVGATSLSLLTEESSHSVTLFLRARVQALAGAERRLWRSLPMPAVGATGSSPPPETSTPSATRHTSDPREHRTLPSL